MTTKAKSPKNKKSGPSVIAPEAIGGDGAAEGTRVAVSGTKFKPNAEAIRPIDIREVITNSENPRESAPQLLSLGYGLFVKLEGSDKPHVVGLALSANPDDKAEYVKLIDKFEPSIAEMAADIAVNGLIHPVTVRPLADDSGYDLVVGCRRCLAILYNHCKENDKPVVEAVVRAVTNTQALYMAFSENAHRMNMSPIEQARWFAQMKNGGMKVTEIADKTKIDHQIVRQRLDLLKLPQELQDKVHEGELGVVKALKIVKGKTDPKTPGATGKGGTGKGDGTRRTVPSLKDFSAMYEEREDLHEKVREFIALEILQVVYMTFKALAAEKAKVEAAANGKGGKGKGKKDEDE